MRHNHLSQSATGRGWAHTTGEPYGGRRGKSMVRRGIKRPGRKGRR